MMASKNPWEDAYRDMIERGRERVDPPTAEELLAFSQGEMNDADAERMRERIAWYPELAAAMSEDEPMDDEAPVLTREQVAFDWELIQQRVQQPQQMPATAIPTRTSWWRQWSTIAPAITTLLFAGLFARSLITIHGLREELEKPRENVERVELYAAVPRGPVSSRPIVLQPSTKYVVLVLNVPEVNAAEARVEIKDLEAEPPGVVWSSGIMRGSDGTFSIEIPRTFLHSRSYEIGLFTDAPDPAARFTIWISGSPRAR